MRIPELNIRYTIYYRLKESTEWIAWMTNNYPSLDIDEPIGHVGAKASDDLKDSGCPIIRYKVTRYSRAGLCDGDKIRTLEFTWYIESRDNSLVQAGEIRDLMRDVFGRDKGRYFGTITEDSNYQTAIISAGYDYIPIRAWDFKETFDDQVNTQDYLTDDRKFRFTNTGYNQITVIKFTGTVAPLLDVC